MRILLILLPLIFLLTAKDISGLEKYQANITKTINELNNTTQKAILQTALRFVKSNKIIKGSCWDYIDAIYNENNITKEQRKTVFKSKKNGFYADSNLLKSGDWVYHINHLYNNIEHSGLFITWVDKNTSKALMLSYAGEKKKISARFRAYNINQTYTIIRAKGVNMQEFIPLKEYATKNKISIFNAMKLAKNGKLESITKIVDGKEQIFIKANSKAQIIKSNIKEPTIKELMQEIQKLKQRIKQLENKINHN